MKIRSATRLLLLAALVTAASCGAESPAGGSRCEVARDGPGRERVVVVDHLGGEATVRGIPSRVVALSPLCVENLVALGVTPTAMAEFAEGGPSNPHLAAPPYLARALEGVPVVGSRNEPNLEAVLLHEPDLILGVADHLPHHDLLSRVAPTILFRQVSDWRSKERQVWRRSLRVLGAVLDREERAERRLAEYDAAAAEAREALEEAVGDETVLLVRTMAKTCRVHGRAHATVGHVLYEDLGLRPPPGLPDDWTQVNVSFEKLAELDPDHIFLLESNEDLTRELREGPIWRHLRAVLNDHVYEVDLYWIRGHGFFGKTAIVEDAVRLLRSRS